MKRIEKYECYRITFSPDGMEKCILKFRTLTWNWRKFKYDIDKESDKEYSLPFLDWEWRDVQERTYDKDNNPVMVTVRKRFNKNMENGVFTDAFVFKATTEAMDALYPGMLGQIVSIKMNKRLSAYLDALDALDGSLEGYMKTKKTGMKELTNIPLCHGSFARFDAAVVELNSKREELNSDLLDMRTAKLLAAYHCYNSIIRRFDNFA